MTGRGSSAQWHTGSRTDKSAILRKLAPTTLHVEINPADAGRLGVIDGARVEVCSRRGAVAAVALVTTIVQPGQIFLPMHFPDVNKLTLASFDPHSRQPSYKACAVTIIPMSGPMSSLTSVRITHLLSTCPGSGHKIDRRISKNAAYESNPSAFATAP